MYTAKAISTSIIIGFFTFSSLHAQVVRNTAEAIDNQQAQTVNEAQLERDLYELKMFKAQLQSLEIALEQRDLQKVQVLKMELVKDMKREIDQSERKIAQDYREVAESSSELNASNRELRRSQQAANTNGRTVQEQRALTDDRRDRNDDRQDIRDDQLDLRNQVDRTIKQKHILHTIEAFTFTSDASVAEKVAANKALLHEFVKTMEWDINATKVEIREDIAESNEDRRERREDRRIRRSF